MNRKAFLQTGFRLGMLTLITGGALFLVRQNRIDFKCTADERCKSCSKFTACDLDKAKQTQKNER